MIINHVFKCYVLRMAVPLSKPVFARLGTPSLRDLLTIRGAAGIEQLT